MPLTILAGSKVIILVHTQFAQYQLGLLQFIQVETKAFTTLAETPNIAGAVVLMSQWQKLKQWENRLVVQCLVKNNQP